MTEQIPEIDDPSTLSLVAELDIALRDLNAASEFSTRLNHSVSHSSNGKFATIAVL